MPIFKRKPNSRYRLGGTLKCTKLLPDGQKLFPFKTYLFNILLQDALEELRSSDFDLYAKAIELDMASLPFVATGPTSTPGLISSAILFAGFFSH